MPPIEQVPTTYLGLFVFLMMGMWGLIVLMVRSMLSNQRDTAANIQKFGQETAAHMAAANEITRTILAEQVRAASQTATIMPSYIQLVGDAQDIKTKLLDVIVKLAQQTGAQRDEDKAQGAERQAQGEFRADYRRSEESKVG